ncbi:putative mediator of RNA polymerase II transcription subunit 12 isoform X8 [Alosa alosa]|uniref:putative mediator of RNA polymerase II transcription subunit 12 isoform X8 n=1 Tax=Alosa alosa TaxID=278164 RepID=UPI002015413C|nr:putative mediator of RNA polymerase II transcription subunit 12 isoform X8 [Alosa alosa]
MDDKVTPDMEALELRLQEGEVDSQQVLEHQVKANRLLRQQLDDLQKRLDEKENQLIEANEIIRALRDEVQTLHRQLMQQTSHQQLEQQTLHQQLEQQTPHQQLEQQTPHQQLEQQTPHQQLEQQTPHQHLEQQRRLKLTRQSTVALSPPKRRAPHKFVTFRVCLLSDPHMHILSRQKGNASRKIKVPTSLSAKEFHSFLRGNTGKGCLEPQKRSHNAQETHTPPSVQVTVQTDVGNGDSHETMDTADADTSSNASDCHSDPDPDEPESGSSGHRKVTTKVTQGPGCSITEPSAETSIRNQ